MPMMYDVPDCVIAALTSEVRTVFEPLTIPAKSDACRYGNVFSNTTTACANNGFNVAGCANAEAEADADVVAVVFAIGTRR